MSFMKLPAEIHIKIFAHCAKVTKFAGQEEDEFSYNCGQSIDWSFRNARCESYWNDHPCHQHGPFYLPAPEVSEELEEEVDESEEAEEAEEVEEVDESEEAEEFEESTSEIWQAMPDLDVNALCCDTVRIRQLAVLYVCRTWYEEAIPIFYANTIFLFQHAVHLRAFSENASRMHNSQYIKKIIIVVHLWEVRHYGRKADDGCQWQDLFEDCDGLHNLVPCLEELTIEFEPNVRGKSRYYCYVDGGTGYIGSSGWEQFSRREPSFDDFRDALKRMVRVEKVRVLNLEDSGLAHAMEDKMMGKEDDPGHWTNRIVPSSGVESA
ncbi:hypothetical protein MMC17_006175 [Xylographa soralifera]|nr:hypothetical protein [Xylographa soralifera]